MTGRVLYGCAVICMMLAIYSFGGISIGFAFGLLIATVAFAAAGALLSAVQEMRDIMRKQSDDKA